MPVSWDPLFAGVFVVLSAAVALYSLAIPERDRRWWLFAALLAAFATAGMLAAGLVTRVLLLDAAAFIAVGLVWTRGTLESARAARTYLALLALATVCILAGLAAGGLLGPEAKPIPAYPWNRIALGLLLAGFILKLALVPGYFWLPGVAEAASPMTTALIIGIVDVAAFSELAHLRLEASWLFGPANRLWLAVALLSMFGGALLALGQRDVKRMLAFSTIDDMGYLLLGLVAGPGAGLTGALAGALSHALFKTLLFGSVGVVEHDSGRPLTLDGPENRGLLIRYPVAGASFLAGALGMIGVPPLFGFAGRWRLYLAAAQIGGIGLLLAAAVATGLGLLYYVRAVHRVWFGPASTPAVAAREPRLAAAVLVGLIVVALALGLYPSILTRLLP